MSKDHSGSAGLTGRGRHDPEHVLSRMIAATAAVEGLGCDPAGQVPSARLTRILLLAQDMERLVQNLHTILHCPMAKNTCSQFQGIVRRPLPH